MSGTGQQIHYGNPCEKADMLHQIKKGIEELPTTDSLDRECMHYLDGMAKRERRMTEEEVVRLLVDASMLEDYSDEGTLNLDGSQDDFLPTEPPMPAMMETLGRDGPERSKNNQKMSATLIERIIMHKKRRNKDVLATDDSPDAVPLNLV
jgi:hypothetical protein